MEALFVHLSIGLGLISGCEPLDRLFKIPIKETLKVLGEYEHFSHTGKQISAIYFRPQIYNHDASKFNNRQSSLLAIMHYIMVYAVSYIVFLLAGRKVGSHPNQFFF